MNVLLYILFLLFITVGAAVLQVFLSKSPSKWPGLILPAVALLLSVIPVLNVMSSGKPWQDILVCALLFLLSNIPTAILLAIYGASRRKSGRKSQINKMNVQDL